MPVPVDGAIRRGLVVLVPTLVGANLVANWLLPRADVAVGVTLTVVLPGIARFAGLRRAELGLMYDRVRPGLRWGLGAAAVVTAGYGVAYAALTLSGTAPGGAGSLSLPVLATALVVIPLATVVPEELAFRGVLWGMLRRGHGPRFATLASSVLFGFWHVLPALGGGAAYDTAGAVLGEGPGAVALRVVGTVLVTGVGGVVLCELRRRSDSLLAPVLAHWALNGVGVLFAAAAL